MGRRAAGRGDDQYPWGGVRQCWPLSPRHAFDAALEHDGLHTEYQIGQHACSRRSAPWVL